MTPMGPRQLRQALAAAQEEATSWKRRAEYLEGLLRAYITSSKDFSQAIKEMEEAVK